MPKIKEESSAVTHAAISVVNALVTGRGAAIGIDLECKVGATLVQSEEKSRRFAVSSDEPDAHGLVKTSALFALRYINRNPPKGYSLNFSVESKIPPAAGLKSSSAVSAAVVESVFALFNMKNDPKAILDVSCSASKRSGASITGAYDDASASLLGGLVLTNNRDFEIVKHVSVPAELGSIVLVRVPRMIKRFTSSIDTGTYTHFRKDSIEAFEYAGKRQIAQAMVENSIVQCAALGYSFKPITEALMAGASAAGISGKGPSIAAICSNAKTASRIRKTWMHGEGIRVITTEILQPRTLFRNN